ncbi:MAG: GlsB/YeaQ/YmgE family stress response membrane protein [Acidobacteria bacterium]|nr:GlsB/YeaQ/YmgE family stress response membrane protein [Acidobacteriota bacterium]
MWEIITTAFVGLIVGLIARFVLPGKDPMGLLMTMVLGIAGSFIGKFIGMNILHLSRSASTGWIMSIIGAVILLFLYRLVAGRSNS